MSITSANITTEVISDFAAGRLDEVDAQAVQQAVDHDEVIAKSVLDARLVALRMNVWLSASPLAAPASGVDRTRAAYLQ
jgi:hypothetical protein